MQPTKTRGVGFMFWFLEGTRGLDRQARQAISTSSFEQRASSQVKEATIPLISHTPRTHPFPKRTNSVLDQPKNRRALKLGAIVRRILVPVQSVPVKKVTRQSEVVALVPSVPSTVKKTLLLSGTASGTHVDWV
ncbi:hypothetical protein KC342_g121 [Hortaea werneckii]|nr:hypothetical protein KC342_g121 [Hortaea werneckii]